MSILATTHPTLLDVAKRLDANGNVDTIVEMLNETNEVLDDMVFLECNNGTSHKTTIRTGLPEPTWRKLYGGVQPTKSTTAQISDSCGMLEAYAEVDKAQADLYNNAADYRLSEDQAHIEGMSQSMAETIFYGSEDLNPERFTGLSARFNSSSAVNGENVLLDGTVDGSDNTSIWLVIWGPRTCHGIYPKGSKAGIHQEDKGQVTIENVDGTGGRMEAYRTHYRWDCGLVVRDWRYIVRIVINQEDLTPDISSGPDLVDLMTQATELVPSLQAGRAAFYMNRKTRSFLRRQITSKVSNSTLTVETVAGKRVTMFDEIPVRRVDALLNTEQAVA